MKSKFETIFENYATRFQRGGFLPGDMVAFKSNVFDHPDVKAGSDEYKEQIQALIDKGWNLRISSLTSNADNSAMSADPDGSAKNYHATIYPSLPGNSAGATHETISVPLEVLDWKEKHQDAAQSKVRDAFKRDADKNVNHTNQKKATADKEDDSYDKGKDFKGGFDARVQQVSNKGLEDWKGDPYPNKKKKK